MSQAYNELNKIDIIIVYIERTRCLKLSKLSTDVVDCGSSFQSLIVCGKNEFFLTSHLAFIGWNDPQCIPRANLAGVTRRFLVSTCVKQFEKRYIIISRVCFRLCCNVGFSSSMSRECLRHLIYCDSDYTHNEQHGAVPFLSDECPYSGMDPTQNWRILAGAEQLFCMPCP